MKESGYWQLSLVISLLFVGFMVWSTSASWSERSGLNPEKEAALESLDERSLAVSAVTNAVSTGVTGASILLGIVSVVVGLGTAAAPAARPHFIIAAGFCVLSLLAATFNMAGVPQLAWTQNVAFSSFVGRLLGLQIWSLVPAFLSVFWGVLLMHTRKAEAASER